MRSDAPHSGLNSPRPHFWVLAVLFVLLPLLFRPGILSVSNLPKETFSAVMLGLALAVFASAALFKGEALLLRIAPRSLWIAIYGLLGLALVSIAWATNRHLAIEHVFQWGVAALGFFVIAGTGARRSECFLILSAVVVGVSLNAAFALYQHYFSQVPDFQVAAPAGSYVNKNFAAQVTVTALPLATLGFFALPSARQASVSLACALCLSLHLFHTFTRAAWVAALVSLGTALFLVLLTAPTRRACRQHFTRVRGILVSCALILFLLGANYSGERGVHWRIGEAFGRAASIGQIGEIDRSAAEDPGGTPNYSSSGARLAMWRNAIELMRDRFLLGVGEGNFQVEFPPYANRIHATGFSSKEFNLRYLHQDYLELCIELGILAVPLGILFLYGNVSSLRRVWRATGDVELQWIGLATASALLALMVTALFSGALYWPAQRVLLLSLTGVLAACGLLAGPVRPAFTLKPGRWTAVILLVCGTATALHAGIRHRKMLQAQEHYLAMVGKIRQGEIESALADGLQALRYRPHMQHARMTYGAYLYQSGRAEQALENLERLAADFPNDYRNRSNLAAIYKSMGDTEAALRNYDWMLRIVPGDPKAATRAAALCDTHGQVQRAETYLLAYATGRYAAPEAYVLLAQLALAHGRPGDARRHLDLGRARFPDSAELVDPKYALPQHVEDNKTP